MPGRSRRLLILRTEIQPTLGAFNTIANYDHSTLGWCLFRLGFSADRPFPVLDFGIVISISREFD